MTKENGISGTRGNDIRIYQAEKVMEILASEKLPLRLDDFKKIYLAELKADGMSDIKIPAADNTIRNDIKSVGFEIVRGKIQLGKSDFNARSLFGYRYAYLIRQIRFVKGDNEKILFDPSTWTKDDNYKTFLANLEECSPMSQEKESIENNHSLCKVLFIMKEQGLETLLAEAFNEHVSRKNNFLYITKHEYCVEFTLEFCMLRRLLRQMYEILMQISEEDLV